MSHTVHKAIPITNLMINTENPRFEIVENQKEAIALMIDDQEDKLIKLAKDILEFGLNPSKYICVTPHLENKEQYIVLEGNRRVTALKLLHNPNLSEGKNQAFTKKIKELSNTFKISPINEVNCAVFPNTEAALKWIELEHTGQNNGIGIVGWDAQQTARFEQRVKGTVPLALQAIELLQRSTHTEAKLKADLTELSITNFQRLLGDPNVREVLGLRLKDKILYTELEETEIIRGLSRIAADFIYNERTVYDIDRKQDREKYIERTFKEKSYIPDKSKKSKSPWNITSAIAKKSPTKSTPAPKPKGVPISHDRKTLIPRDCIISIQDEQDKRVNQIYHELKNLDIDSYVNAVSVLFRVFLELSIDTFIAKKHIKSFQGINKMTPLREKIEKVLQYFESNQLLTEEQLKPIKVAIDKSNRHSIFAIDTFNAYVHNRHYNPNPTDLKITWDNIQVFIEKIWENIK